MTKLSLIANPTFKAKVGIPIAGGNPVEVEFIFKHRTKTELDKWLAIEHKSDVNVILDVASAWDLQEPFDESNVSILCQNYIGSSREIIKKYVEELTQAKLGN